MGLISLLLVICITSGMVHGQETNIDESEKDFEKEFNIKYADKEDAKAAAKELADAEAEINEHNKKFLAGNSTFFEDLNPLSNIPDDTFEKQKTGIINPSRSLGLNRKPEHLWTTDVELLEFYNQRQTIPNEYDSVAKGWVTPVKNQLDCGSCAAFAGTAVIETCMLKAGARFNGLDLSEQFVVNCGYNGDSMDGCDGAYPGAYTKWYGKNFYLGQGPHELTMPYQNLNPSLTCPSNGSISVYNPGARVVSVLGDDFCNEDKLKQLVFQYGAVESVINADLRFINYAGGIFQGCSSKDFNHAITVVGFGTENGVPYWKVKNSWGASWGNKGYVKVLRGSGECGIGKVCTVANCAPTSAPLSPIPTPPPSPSSCDLSKYFGPGFTRAGVRIRFGSIESKCDCVNSICTPSSPGPIDACKYICGRSPC